MMIFVLLTVSLSVNAQCYTINGTAKINTINPIYKSGEVNLFLTSTVDAQEQFNGNLKGEMTLMKLPNDIVSSEQKCDPVMIDGVVDCTFVVLENVVTGQLCVE